MGTGEEETLARREGSMREESYAEGTADMEEMDLNLQRRRYNSLEFCRAGVRKTIGDKSREGSGQ